MCSFQPKYYQNSALFDNWWSSNNSHKPQPLIKSNNSFVNYAKNPLKFEKANYSSFKRNMEQSRYINAFLGDVSNREAFHINDNAIFYLGKAFISRDELQNWIQKYKSSGYGLIITKSDIKRGRYNLKCDYNSKKNKMIRADEKKKNNKTWDAFVNIYRGIVNKLNLDHNHDSDLLSENSDDLISWKINENNEALSESESNDEYNLDI